MAAATMQANVPTMKAADLMHKGVETISGSATVADALKKMRAKKVSSLIVERRDPNDAWGIVTKKDIVTKAIDPGPSRRTMTVIRVHEIMSRPLITVSPGLAIEDCVWLMKLAGVASVPVFDGKEVVGILSFSNAFNNA
jgi:CBS domain-containing protein